MELTRRDVLAALAAASAGCSFPEDASGDGFDSNETETLVSLAEVLYPSDVSGIEAFVRDYSIARVEGRESYREGMRDALAELDEHAGTFHGEAFAALPASTRDEALRGLGADVAEPVPDGETRERVRYYLVNELLFALYTTPTGSELLGTENPPGHPGGIQSYQGAR